MIIESNGASKYLKDVDASDQYWNQRPMNGYVQAGRKPQFDASASGRPGYLENIHKPGNMTLGEMFDDGSAFATPSSDDPAYPDA